MSMLQLPDEAATLVVGSVLGALLEPGMMIYLSGDLGAGKTTLVRGILSGMGYEGTVKSPTYTLVETYTLARGTVYHFDLYRVRDPQEIEFMGVREYFVPEAICIVEWPECGEGELPTPDVYINLQENAGGRCMSCSPGLERGALLLESLMGDARCAARTS